MTQEFLLLAVADFTDVLDERVTEQRLDEILEVIAIDSVDFGRDSKRQPDALCDLDRAIDALLGRHSPDEGEIVARLGSKAVQVLGQAVVHRADPVRERQRLTLCR